VKEFARPPDQEKNECGKKGKTMCLLKGRVSLKYHQCSMAVDAAVLASMLVWTCIHALAPRVEPLQQLVDVQADIRLGPRRLRAAAATTRLGLVPATPRG
jgi:hypothetical protein